MAKQDKNQVPENTPELENIENPTTVESTEVTEETQNVETVESTEVTEETQNVETVESTEVTEIAEEVEKVEVKAKLSLAGKFLLPYDPGQVFKISKAQATEIVESGYGEYVK